MAVPSGAQPPLLDQQHLVAVDGDRFVFVTIKRQPLARAAPGRRRAARDRRGRCRHGAAEAGSCPSRPEPVARAQSAVQPWERRRFPANQGPRAPVSRSRARPRGVAALEAQCRSHRRDHDRCVRSPGRSGDVAGLACSASEARPWAEPVAGHAGSRAAAPIRPSVRVGPAGIWGLPSDRCGPFSEGPVQL